MIIAKPDELIVDDRLICENSKYIFTDVGADIYDDHPRYVEAIHYDFLSDNYRCLYDMFITEQRRADEAHDYGEGQRLDAINANKLLEEAQDKFDNLLDEHNKYINKTSDVDAKLVKLQNQYNELVELYSDSRQSERCLLRIIREKM
jgi:hypothetical protein